MTTATDSATPTLGPVAVPARVMADLDHLRRGLTADAARSAQALARLAAPTIPDLSAPLRAAASQAQALEAATASTREIARRLATTAEAIRRHALQAAENGRSDDLARLSRRARRLTRGNAALSVRAARIVADLRAQGRTATADYVALALSGDAEARQAFHDLAGQDATALAVVGILRDLADLDEQTRALADAVADLIAPQAVARLISDADPVPPPRAILGGSVDVCAPPLPHGARRGRTSNPGRLPMTR